MTHHDHSVPLEFRQPNGCEENGVLVGCDLEQEWLLPWWWEHYRECNAFPVTFIDFGMSKEAREWCEEKGETIALDIPESLIVSKEEMDPSLISYAEAVYGESVWVSRKAWFKKPFSLLHSPYKRTLWMDLDCEVLRSVSPLFEYCQCASGFAIAREPILTKENEMEHQLLNPGEVLYNSGVMVYQRNCPLVKQWIESTLAQNRYFWGDQQVLSRLIFQNQIPVQELPEIYNWRISQGLHLGAVIIHWAGKWGKNFIKTYGGVSKDLKDFMSL